MSREQLVTDPAQSAAGQRRPTVRRFLVYCAAFLIASLALLALIVPHGPPAIDPCEDTIASKESPGSGFRAEMKTHTCAWGFGLAAETVTVKVTKLGPDGWFMFVPIEFDSTADDAGLPNPTIRWTSPDNLVIHVVSKVRLGTLQWRKPGLTVVREYAPM